MTNKRLSPVWLTLVVLPVCLALMAAACGPAGRPAAVARPPAMKPVAQQSSVPGKADVAPAFALPDAHGRLVRLADLLQTQEAIVLVFYQSPYCRVCLELLVDLEQHRSEFAQRRAQIVAVASQSTHEAVSTVAATGAQYPILADVDHRTAVQYGVLPLLPGRVKGGQALVSVFIIGQDGRLVWKFGNSPGTLGPSSGVILANLPVAVTGK